MVTSLINYLADLLFPLSCKLCGSSIRSGESPGLCEDCWSTIRFVDGPCCPRCGKPYASDAALSHTPNHRCGDCRERPPHYDRAVSVAIYEKALAEAIHLFKYSKKTAWSRPLGRLLLKRVSDFCRVDTIVPVPLHPRRLREREFNQSLLLARELSVSSQIPFQVDNLRRVRWTRPQIELSGEERKRNVRRAFEVKWPDLVQGRYILLVDDVFTTGATVNECSRVLKRAGAKAVYVLTVARMVRSFEEVADMPIYEYRCNQCQKKMSFLVLNANVRKELSCKFCKSQDLARLFSRFATVRSEESRLESLADPSALADLDEKDPQSMARWMKKMGKELGEDMGEDFQAETDKTLSEEASEGDEE